MDLMGLVDLVDLVDLMDQAKLLSYLIIESWR
jgi:hypothetical protein